MHYPNENTVLSPHARNTAAALMVISAIGICITSFLTAWLFMHYRPQMTGFDQALQLPENPFFYDARLVATYQYSEFFV